MDYPNRIKFNDKYSISIQPDKAVIGGFFNDPNIHLTVSFGLKSGILDVHLTKNKRKGKSDHYKIMRISHIDLIKVFPFLLEDLFNSFFINQKKLDINWLKKNNFKVMPLKGINSDFDKTMDREIENFMEVLNTSKRRFSLNPEDKTFIEKSKDFSSRFSVYNNNNLYEPEVLNQINNGYGFLISNKEFLFFFRSISDSIKKEFMSDSLNLTLSRIIRATLGEQIDDCLKLKIQEGLEVFSSFYTDKDLECNKGLIITIN